MATTTLTQVELQSFPNNSSPWVPNTGIVQSESDPEDIRQDTTPPNNAVEALQKWNYPPKNVYRVGASFWGFFLMGYTFASLVNDTVHVKFGQRGVAVIAGLCHLIAYIVISLHPPYPVLVVMYVFVGMGNGLVDAAWCAWLGNMVSANQVQGFLQACYSFGGTIAPLIAAGMLAKTGLEWYYFYYIMTAVAATELVTSAWAFWAQTGHVYAMENPRDVNAKTGRLREALSNKLTWIFAAFIFGYVGAEVSLGGWIVTFMTQVRSGTTFSSSLTSTGFWAGMTVGRMGLAFLTAWLGEFTSVLVYLGICIALELLFWFIPSFYVSAVAIAFLGMFLGPLFPTAIVLVTKLIPKELHVGSIGFATAFGGSGGAVFPFIVGALAQAMGVKALQPVVLALLVTISGLWMLVPRKGKRDEEVARVRWEGVVGAN
ncbi:hypothetical protein BGAL_0021g00040 [Botrytis galanthina]|uniref:Major facilitator superfamily (MFS) profile domain-containing protein n=1 Tax=Botrytis galanthina TaxID=278940 RepID=A0A4S8RBY8_9HELO|nr:hypothetical protein BGAL_0021g00040 [Botrytis galanthina]